MDVHKMHFVETIIKLLDLIDYSKVYTNYHIKIKSFNFL